MYDYVTFVDGKIVKSPTDVGEDCSMNEGPTNGLPNVEGLFHQIDRDDNPDTSIMNTVDLKNDNNRKVTTSVPVKGFKLFLLLMGTNNFLVKDAQNRLMQMFVAANPCPSNYCNDEHWMQWLTNEGSVTLESVTGAGDSGHLHCGGVNRLSHPSG